MRREPVELKDFLPAETIVRNEWTMKGVPKGQRNDTLYRVCRGWHWKDGNPGLYREAEAFKRAVAPPPARADGAEEDRRRRVHAEGPPRLRTAGRHPRRHATPAAASGNGVYVNLGTVQAEAVTWVYPT